MPTRPASVAIVTTLGGFALTAGSVALGIRLLDLRWPLDTFTSPSASISLFLSGAALLLVSRTKAAPAAAVSAVLGVFFALLSLANAPPALTGTEERLSLALSGAALAMAALNGTPWLRHVLGLAALVLAAGASISHLFRLTEPTAAELVVQLDSVLGVAVLGLAAGVLTLQPDRGVARLLTSDGFVAHLIRRLLPAAIVIPVALGWLILLGYRAGIFQIEVALSLAVIGTLAVLAVVLWVTARAILAIDARRAQAVSALADLQQTLESSLAAQTEALSRSHQEATGRDHAQRTGQRMEALGQLAGNIAHDVGNLVTVIAGYSSILLRRMDTTSEFRPAIQEIKKAADHCSALTRNLLAFSSRQALSPAVLDLGETIADLCNMLPMMVGEDISVVARHDPDLWPVKADVAQIEQVIVNLVVNARDAMPHGGTLRIEASNVEVGHRDRPAPELAPGGYVCLLVSDTGVGMNAETLARAFDPFFTTKAPSHGTGLGLSIAYGIIKQSRGVLLAESRPGAGTTFRIYLPRVQEPVQATAPMPERRSGIETILLVEDDEAVLSLFSLMLREAGYTVLEAHNGLEGLRRAGDHQGVIHLLLTDVVMPGLSGPDLAGALLRDRPELAVLLVSGYPRVDEDAEDTWAFLRKPVAPEVLLTTVRDLLDSSLARGGVAPARPG